MSEVLDRQAAILTAARHAGDHIARVVQLLIDGVAFPTDGKTYEVFSHEGDELGSITTADLGFAINLMRRMGREPGKCKHYTYDPATKTFPPTYQPAFTFAWVGWIGH
jgi:hypothetical protein